jgi:hypothetical protein
MNGQWQDSRKLNGAISGKEGSHGIRGWDSSWGTALGLLACRRARSRRPMEAVCGESCSRRRKRAGRPAIPGIRAEPRKLGVEDGAGLGGGSRGASPWHPGAAIPLVAAKSNQLESIIAIDASRSRRCVVRKEKNGIDASSTEDA